MHSVRHRGLGLGLQHNSIDWAAHLKSNTDRIRARVRFRVKVTLRVRAHNSLDSAHLKPNRVHIRIRIAIGRAF